MHGLEKERKERSAERTTFKGREEQAQRSPTSLARLQVACSSRFYRKVMKSSTGHPKRFPSHASSASRQPSFPRPPRLVILISSAGRTSAVGPNRVITLSSGPHFCLYHHPQSSLQYNWGTDTIIKPRLSLARWRAVCAKDRHDDEG
jgi:hypothetical protein